MLPNMPKSAQGWLGFAITVVVIIIAIKRIPQVNQYVGL